MFSTVLAAYVVQEQYNHGCLTNGARTTESWLHGRYCTDLSCLPFERQGQDFHGCHYGYWYSSVMAAYTDTAQLLSWLPIWVLEQYRHGCHMGTDTVMSWFPVRDRYCTVMAAHMGTGTVVLS